MESLLDLVDGNTLIDSSDEDLFSVEYIHLNVAVLYTTTDTCSLSDTTDNGFISSTMCSSVNKRVVSLLDKLKRPFPAEVAKQRQVKLINHQVVKGDVMETHHQTPRE